jgi:flavin-dependent dehydrogenase
LFDHGLFDAARAETTAREDTAVTDILRTNGRVTGVVCRAGGREREIRARVVVGADGFDSVVARRLGFYRHDSSRWFVATRGYYRGLDVAPRTVEVHFVRDTLPGFLWIFPTGDGMANVGLGLVHRDLKRRRVRLRDVHEAVLQSPRFRDRFARAERVGNVHGWNLPTPDPRRTLAGDGFLLVGDAAGLVDPFSGEGIGNALASARVAGDVIAQSIRDGEPDCATAQYPSRLWAAVDAREIALHYRLRAVARRERVIDFVVGRAGAHSDVLQWVRRMTSEHGALVHKQDLLSPLTYARLLLRRR